MDPILQISSLVLHKVGEDSPQAPGPRAILVEVWTAVAGRPVFLGAERDDLRLVFLGMRWGDHRPVLLGTERGDYRPVVFGGWADHKPDLLVGRTVLWPLEGIHVLGHSLDHRRFVEIQRLTLLGALSYPVPHPRAVVTRTSTHRGSVLLSIFLAIILSIIRMIYQPKLLTNQMRV